MALTKKHEWDSDGTCACCGFDGAEFHWWKNSTYEGKASNETQPECKEHNSEDYEYLNDYED